MFPKITVTWIRKYYFKYHIEVTWIPIKFNGYIY